MPKYSKEHTSELVESMRRIVMDLCERAYPAGPQVPCDTCGHGILDHPDGVCEFPRTRGLPSVLCKCFSFRAPSAEG